MTRVTPKPILLLILLCGLVACSRPYAIYVSETTPQALQLRSQPIGTRLIENPSALEQKYERLVISELRRRGSGFNYDPRQPKLIMSIAAHRGTKVTGFTTGPRFLGSSSEFEEADHMTVDVSVSKTDGPRVWDAQMRGDLDWLTGEDAQKCVRVLLSLFGQDHAGEEFHCE